MESVELVVLAALVVAVDVHSDVIILVALSYFLHFRPGLVSFLLGGSVVHVRGELPRDGFVLGQAPARVGFLVHEGEYVERHLHDNRVRQGSHRRRESNTQYLYQKRAGLEQGVSL